MKYPVLAKRFKALRAELDTNERDCTQDKLAKMLYITKTQISELERGKREPSVTELKAYGKLFDVPMEYLLGLKTNRIRKYTNNLGLEDESINILKEIQKSLPYLKFRHNPESGYIEEAFNAEWNELRLHAINLIIKDEADFNTCLASYLYTDADRFIECEYPWAIYVNKNDSVGKIELDDIEYIKLLKAHESLKALKQIVKQGGLNG